MLHTMSWHTSYIIICWLGTICQVFHWWIYQRPTTTWYCTVLKTWQTKICTIFTWNIIGRWVFIQKFDLFRDIPLHNEKVKWCCNFVCFGGIRVHFYSRVPKSKGCRKEGDRIIDLFLALWYAMLILSIKELRALLGQQRRKRHSERKNLQIEASMMMINARKENEKKDRMRRILMQRVMEDCSLKRRLHMRRNQRRMWPKHHEKQGYVYYYFTWFKCHVDLHTNIYSQSAWLSLLQLYL